MFQLNQQLAADTVKIGSFALSEVLLMNDCQYPWVILVPRHNDMTEVHQLSKEDQRLLMQESVFVAGKMQVHFQADKMNVAALGNVVSQLHIHHIARYQTDACWPKPVWGMNKAVAYKTEELEILTASLQALFAEAFES